MSIIGPGLAQSRWSSSIGPTATTLWWPTPLRWRRTIRARSSRRPTPVSSTVRGIERAHVASGHLDAQGEVHEAQEGEDGDPGPEHAAELLDTDEERPELVPAAHRAHGGPQHRHRQARRQRRHPHRAAVAGRLVVEGAEQTRAGQRGRQAGGEDVGQDCPAGPLAVGLVAPTVGGGGGGDVALGGRRTRERAGSVYAVTEVDPLHDHSRPPPRLPEPVRPLRNPGPGSYFDPRGSAEQARAPSDGADLRAHPALQAAMGAPLEFCRGQR